MEHVVSDIDQLRQKVRAARLQNKTIGFVPTMGALHDGHASLVRLASQESDFVVVSIFVNPTQFGPNEDLAKYPRTLEADVKLCIESGVKLIFFPTVETMYPQGSVTWVEVKELDRYLCGPSRPGHFRGVCTVVAKLFNLVQPDLSFFGAKDAQQIRIIKQMVRDLNIPTHIVSCPTVREHDGLAMSSRNRYLKPDERAVAPKIYQALNSVRDHVKAGELNVEKLEAELKQQLAKIPGARVDYAQIVDDVTLQKVAKVEKPVLVATATFIGTTRLIDNITIE